jgi:hypothetical protein
MLDQQNQLVYGIPISDEDIGEILAWSENDLTKHDEYVRKLQKKTSWINVLLGVAAIVFGLVAAILGFMGFTPVWYLLVVFGILAVVAGPIILARNLLRAAKGGKESAQADMAYDDLEKVCELFYSHAFGKGWAQTISLEDRIVEAADVIPFSVLRRYEESILQPNTGWTVLESTAAVPGSLEEDTGSLECVHCHKTTPHSKKSNASIPFRKDLQIVKDEHFLQSSGVYTKCQHCGQALCYHCYVRLGYLCPVCGKATDGMSGLQERWQAVRWEILRKAGLGDVDKVGAGAIFKLIKMVFPVTGCRHSLRDNPNIAEVSVSFQVGGYQLQFNNVAVKVAERWFLASPEPGK